MTVLDATNPNPGHPAPLPPHFATLGCPSSCSPFDGSECRQPTGLANFEPLAPHSGLSVQPRHVSISPCPSVIQVHNPSSGRSAPHFGLPGVCSPFDVHKCRQPKPWAPCTCTAIPEKKEKLLSPHFGLPVKSRHVSMSPVLQWSRCTWVLHMSPATYGGSTKLDLWNACQGWHARVLSVPDGLKRLVGLETCQKQQASIKCLEEPGRLVYLRLGKNGAAHEPHLRQSYHTCQAPAVTMQGCFKEPGRPAVASEQKQCWT